MNEAESLFNQAAEMEARAAKFRNLENLAKAPAGRVGEPILPHQDRSNTGSRHQYSLLRAIRGQIDAMQGRGSLDGLEYEVHCELEKLRGKPAAGLIVPWDAPVSRDLLPHNIHRRDLTTSTGAGAVGTYTMPTMIDILRAKLVLFQLGASVITDQRQQFSLPRTTATVTAGVVATEGTNVAASNPTIDDLDFTYHGIEATTKLSRQFINGASVSAENYIVDQITKTIANKLQSDCLNGAGSSGAVKGLLKYTNGTEGITVKAFGTDGANPTWADIVGMTGSVNTANSGDDSLAWLINPTTAAYLMSLVKVSGQARFVLDTDNLIAGYPYASSSLVPNNLTKGSSGATLSAAAFGNWSDMIIGMFTGIDLFVDPYSTQPHVRVTGAVDFDMHVAHPAAWAITVDLKTA
jgi:HK97 family phage major capsid protein